MTTGTGIQHASRYLQSPCCQPQSGLIISHESSMLAPATGVAAGRYDALLFLRHAQIPAVVLTV